MEKYERYFSCDFETTVYEGQTSTEVWAASCVELYTEDVKIFHSLEELYNYFLSLNTHVIAYFHNLKFDGSFWLDYFLIQKKYQQAIEKTGENINDVMFLKNKDMPNKSFKYSISDMGQWYTITIKENKHIIELRDSLKLLPFSVERIGKSFKTKHRKLSMKYEGYRYAGCEITEEEKQYIANDVLVVKEALEIMFNEGHKKLTIGSCCLSEFKSTFGCMKSDYALFFPNMYDFELDYDTFHCHNADDWIRKTYRGGWCYLARGKECKQYEHGTTADVNSLYPSMMSSESGNRYPVGSPTFWTGNYIPIDALGENKYYFIHIKTRFYIRHNKLPFIQVKNNLLYDSTESLETSDIYSKELGKYISKYEYNGEVKDTRLDLYLTMTDYKLFMEHYRVKDFEIIDGCWFWSEIGLFDTYINKYKKLKMESKDALRELAKLFLNNLYGKMAASMISNFKFAIEKDDGTIGFLPVVARDKTPGYIPVGSAITSYARNFTIRAAQMNYYGKNNRGFIYADTDSIHCDLLPNEIKGIKIDDKEFCCWKLESCWDIGFFSRQKTYIEHITHENQVKIDNPYYNIKCAGMSDKPKTLFEMSLKGETHSDKYDLNKEDIEFLKTKRTLNDFKIGLKIPGKLIPKRIKGGVLLCETSYEMR